MLNNYVNLHDLVWVATKMPTRTSSVIRKITASGRQRTIDLYSAEPESDQWWVIPEVQRRWNMKVSGDPSVDHYEYLARKYLTGDERVGLSVGCGEGEREIAWARTGAFNRLLGIDLTPHAVQRAREQAAICGLDDVLDFEIGDLTSAAQWRPDGFDVIIGEHSVHHLSPLRQILLSLREQLVRDGLFLIDEFVGPTRFQWTDDQLACANRLLELLPEDLRRERTGHIKRSVYRPSLLYMKLKDPSEAVESSRILPLMDEIFERVEVRPYGGTVLHIILSGIAHNFINDDGEAARYLRVLFEAEDALLETGRLTNDFVVAVYRKR